MMVSDFPGFRSFADRASRLGELFSRCETFERVIAYLKRLLSQCEHKNGWAMPPDGVQYLLERARWDPEAARDMLRQWVADYLGSPDSVLILDETGFIKKGQHLPTRPAADLILVQATCALGGLKASLDMPALAGNPGQSLQRDLIAGSKHDIKRLLGRVGT
jgi:type II secretory pathway component PulJ